MAEHFATQPQPGPVGHGFTQHNLDTGETWWTADLSPHVRAFGLDTCNQVAGPGRRASPTSQFQWLSAELEQAQAENKLVLIFSHHNSLTLENRAQRPGDDRGAPRRRGVRRPAAAATPSSIGWLNGHTHLNQILAHTSRDGRLLGDHDRVVHRLPAAAAGRRDRRQPRRHAVAVHDRARPRLARGPRHRRHLPADLASRSRELAANDWAENPSMRRGSPLDRNTELLLPAPFDLSRDHRRRARGAADDRDAHASSRTRTGASA